MEPVYIAITMDSNEPLRVMQFERGPMRGHRLPLGATWVDSAHWVREATPENIANEISRACPSEGMTDDGRVVQLPKVLSWRVIRKEDVPVDRSYRDAWVDDGSAVVHDLEKCRHIHRAQMREEVAARIHVLNVTGSKGDVKRQELVDAMDDPRIDAAQTLDELRLVKAPS